MITSTVTASLTRVTGTTQYAAGDVIAATAPVTMPFTGLTRKSQEGGLIKSAVAVSSAAQATKIDLELWLFTADITDLDADNAAWTPTDAQLETLIGIIAFPVANWKAGDATSGAGGNAACSTLNIDLGFQSDTLYGVLIARNTYTPVDSEKFTIRLNIEH